MSSSNFPHFVIQRYANNVSEEEKKMSFAIILFQSEQVKTYNINPSVIIRVGDL